ncbi:hypothetical protein HPB47_012552, partial [Ixodes persulcatus]
PEAQPLLSSLGLDDAALTLSLRPTTPALQLNGRAHVPLRGTIFALQNGRYSQQTRPAYHVSYDAVTAYSIAHPDVCEDKNRLQQPSQREAPRDCCCQKDARLPPASQDGAVCQFSSQYFCFLLAAL